MFSDIRRLYDNARTLDITPTQMSVLHRLCDRANSLGLAWPGMDSISQDTKYGRSTIKRAIKLLIENEMIEYATRAELTKEERRTCRLDQNVYRIIFPGGAHKKKGRISGVRVIPVGPSTSGVTLTPEHADQVRSGPGSGITLTSEHTTTNQPTENTIEQTSASHLCERGAENIEKTRGSPTTEEINSMLAQTIVELRQYGG